MKNIFTIAKNTFRETIRDRILYGILGFSLLYIALAILMAKISLSEPVLLKSFGLAGIYLFGSIITVFLGSSTIYKEIERRTFYFIFSKPVSPLQVVLGKFFGLLAAISSVIIIMSIIYFGVLYSFGASADFSLSASSLLAIFFQILETGIFISLLIFFSTITTPLTATIASAMLLFSGHSMAAVLKTAKQAGGIMYRIIQIIYYISPNLDKFNVRDLVVHNIPISGIAILISIGYAIFYISLALYLANFFLRRKEL